LLDRGGHGHHGLAAAHHQDAIVFVERVRLLADDQSAVLDRQGLFDERGGVSRPNRRGEDRRQCLSGL